MDGAGVVFGIGQVKNRGMDVRQRNQLFTDGAIIACDVIGLDRFCEDHLYENLSWLARHQGRIEKKLFECEWSGEKPELFLYDVTSSYLEGECNELGAFGYNRDGKKRKRQIVVRLFSDSAGRPASIGVFPGNTGDTSTFVSQLKKAKRRFGCPGITFDGRT